MSALFALLLALAASGVNAVSPKHAVAATLSPSDPRVKYLGRVDHSNPVQPQLAWVMTGSACTFTTTGAGTISASFSAPKDGARMRVMIDGKLAGFVKVESGGPDAVSDAVRSAAPNTSSPAGTSQSRRLTSRGRGADSSVMSDNMMM